MAVNQISMVEPPDDSMVVIEMTREAFDGLRAAVEVAFDDIDGVPDEYQEIAAAWWAFTHPEAAEQVMSG